MCDCDQPNKHFDCLKNTLPDNFFGSKANWYYNRKGWKNCCKFGTQNVAKRTADKWNAHPEQSDKWTEGCDKGECSNNYFECPRNYFYTYDTRNCGKCKCGKKDKCGRTDPCQCRGTYICNGCQNGRDCGQTSRPATGCNSCKGGSASEKYGKSDKRYISDSCCGCTDVAIVYRMACEDYACDNIVEFKFPDGGSKEKYFVSMTYPEEFVEACKWQCATVPVYNTCQQNLIDNRRQQEFTLSDQNALVKRGINNALYAHRLVEEGKLNHQKYGYEVPMNLASNPTYYYFGDPYQSGSVQTGLTKYDLTRFYFGSPC